MSSIPVWRPILDSNMTVTVRQVVAGITSDFERLRADDPELKAATLGELLAAPYTEDTVIVGETIVRFVPDDVHEGEAMVALLRKRRV